MAVSGILRKIFGSKSDRDMKAVKPVLDKVLAAFQKHKVAEVHFQGTTGYGYDDLGREVLGEIYADIFGTEDAMVRINFVNGTHAIASALYGVLRPGDTLVSAIGAPYDTLQGVIGITGDGNGSLREFGVHYRQVDLTELDEPDLKGIAQAVQEPAVKAVLIQRSRGYATRASLSVEKIGEIIGGSQREERLDVLTARMRELGLKEEDYWWYLDLRRYGSCRHAGFGLGFERMVMYLTGVSNIRDVELHPRTTGNADF